MSRAAELRKRFAEIYGGEARVFRAPGRVNLIGEHTDYNDGFVMPAAIDFFTWVAISPRADRRLRIYSDNFSEQLDLDLDHLPTLPQKHWSDYVVGVADVLESAGLYLCGAELLILGEVPIGAGVSSSAAIEVASALALLGNARLEMNRIELAKLCQRAEIEDVGARVGIMDQFISLHGRADHALMLDCRSLDYRLLPLPAEVKLVICDTKVKHELASGEYNRRRADCELGVAHLKRHLPDIRALRDVTMADLERFGRGLPEVVYRRCRHVVSENARVVQAGAALERGDLKAFGALMAQSHRSLRDDYEVSCRELDVMVELANQLSGVDGARMTGGGFGGCTINLVAADRVADFTRVVADGYQRATGITPAIYVSTAVDGAEEVSS